MWPGQLPGVADRSKMLGVLHRLVPCGKTFQQNFTIFTLKAFFIAEKMNPNITAHASVAVSQQLLRLRGSSMDFLVFLELSMTRSCIGQVHTYSRV